MTFNILVPVYKTERFIHECIESVLNQTYQDFRLILVDDGSPDNCGEICDEYSKKDSRIIVIHQKNMGLLATRRTAINYIKDNFSNDDFAIFLDSDDYLDGLALETIKKVIIKEKSDMIIYSIQCISNNNIVCTWPASKFPENIINKRELYKKIFYNQQFNSLCRKAVKCSLLEKIDYSEYYNVSCGEDLLQSIPLLKNCHKVSFINDFLYYYRSNPSSITHSISYENYKTDNIPRQKVLEFLTSENVFTDNDMKEYFNYCKTLLIQELINIDTMKENKLKKFELYKKIADDRYYSIVIKNTDGAIIQILRMRKFGCLHILLFFYRANRKLKRLVNKNG